jgi:probable F420-dependent oxidoreductase
MKFGIQHASGDPNWGPGILAPGAVAGFARAAEECGYAAIAFTDHPAPSTKWIESGGEGVADPFSALGFCAALTTSIRLLTYVLVPPYRNPFVAAQQVATLDVLSGGRVTLGLGTGYLRGEFRAVGADLEHRRSTFDEHLEVMREAWAGREVNRDSPTFSAPGNQVLPRGAAPAPAALDPRKRSLGAATRGARPPGVHLHARGPRARAHHPHPADR